MTKDVVRTVACRLGRSMAVVILALTLGCQQSSLSKVAGKVTLDGQPLAKGTIEFVPADGVSASAGGEIKEGAYAIEMPPGPKIVRVFAKKVIGQRQAYKGDPNSPMIDLVEEIIPAKYNAETTLKVTVERAGGEHNFALKSK